VVSAPPSLGYAVAALLGCFLGDVLITRDEIRGLMADLLYVNAPPAGTMALSAWAAQHRGELGARYASELARRRRHSQR
jgi:NADH dehydrogenase